MSKPSNQVAVTGASGLVGSHLVEFLAHRGYAVVAVVRSASSAQPFEHKWRTLNVKLVQSDISDFDSLSKRFAGAECVIHAAGVVDPYGLREQIIKTNVEGTRIALSAAKQAGVKQFIFVSSLSVITGDSDQFDLTEDAPRRLCGEAYADSKALAEELVMREAASQQIMVTAVRPGFIYGAREKAWLPRLINSIATGKAKLIDGGKKETNVIYIENLCRAIAGAICNERAYGQLYNLTDGQKVSKKQLFDAISDGLDLPRVTKTVPGFVAKPFCRIVSTVAPLLSVDKQRQLARFSRAAYRLAGVNQGFSIAKAERDLHYLDRVSFAAAMQETLQHFKT